MNLFFDVIGSSYANESEIKSEQKITIKNWHIGLSAGIGAITNPLHGGDNLPLILIPEVAYYGERWFFDNGRLGLSLIDTSTHVVNLVTEFNPETRFFIDWHPSNIFALSGSSLLSAAPDNNKTSKHTASELTISDVKKRHWALDAGLSYHYIFQQHVFSVQTLADVSGVYKGLRAALQWQMHHQLGELMIKPSLGMWYKSSRLNTYFYGVSQKETSNGAIGVGSSWQPYAKIDARLPLSKANSLRLHLAYNDYSALNDSPLFKKTYSMTVFIGFNHIF